MIRNLKILNAITEPSIGHFRSSFAFCVCRGMNITEIRNYLYSIGRKNVDEKAISNYLAKYPITENELEKAKLIKQKVASLVRQ